MPDAFMATLKEFQQVTLEIGETREKLAALEKSGDQLWKQLKALGGSSQSAGPLGNGEASSTLAITEIIEVVRQLGGSARLGDIAKAAKLGAKVAATRIQRAAKAGFLIRAGHGVYKLPADQLAKLVSGTASDSSTGNSASAEDAHDEI